MLKGSSSARDRKHKCNSEQHVRERKSNAQKQFAYNKLKNEKQLTLKHENHKESTAPKRPPQPKLINFEKKEKEGMLIDLSSPQQQENVPPMLSKSVFDSCSTSKMNNISILDAPIDVPTQEYSDEGFNTVRIFDNENSKPDPPPYQSPPTYMNTYGITKPISKYSSSSNVVLNQYGSIDPFDTSHIVASNSQSVASSQSYSVGESSGSMTQNQIETLNYNDLGYLVRPKTSETTEIDEIVKKKMVSLSPKIDRAEAITTSTATTAAIYSDKIKSTIQDSSDPSLKTSEYSQLNDSLKVNLSSLTLNDTDDFELQTMSSMDLEPNENPRLNRAFLMELEKEIYKTASNINVNNTQTNDFPLMSCKENSVSTILNSFNWHKNDFATGSDMDAQVYQQKNATTFESPVKFSNNAFKITNSESASTIMPSNTDVNILDPGAICSSSLNQISKNNVVVLDSNNQPAYCNYTRSNTLCNNNAIGSHEKNCSYDTSSKGTSSKSIYSITNDNVYDTVASSNSDYYESIQVNDGRTVIYDEVAADDIRPHRPAPGPPILSAQQIQRRLERAQKDQVHQLYDNHGMIYANNELPGANHSIYEEICQKTSNDIDLDSKEALNALNSETIKNMKIKQLLR